MDYSVLTKVTPNLIIKYIYSAKENILFLKPSFLKYEIEELLKAKKQKNINISLYMEVGDNAIRYGYGEMDALILIKDNIVVLVYKCGHEKFNTIKYKYNERCVLNNVQKWYPLYG